MGISFPSCGWSDFGDVGFPHSIAVFVDRSSLRVDFCPEGLGAPGEFQNQVTRGTASLGRAQRGERRGANRVGSNRGIAADLGLGCIATPAC